MTSLDPVRQRLTEISEEFSRDFDLGAYFSDRKHTEAGELKVAALVAALTAVLDLIDKSTAKIPEARAEAAKCRPSERMYREGLYDGNGMALEEVRAAVAAELGVTE